MHVYISATLSVRQEIKKGRSSVKYYILCLFIFIKYINIDFLSCWYDVESIYTYIFMKRDIIIDNIGMSEGNI